ncbi:hypothetical protein GCM10010988_12650 [Cnuibacter physcomitrellae]|nr:hypothetical protein GCM10010988_12650 [Cnuibacter physcomitrellae]
MMGIVVVRASDTVAHLFEEGADVDRDMPVGTAYRLRDGWHLKHARRHDRFAWVGPYDSPEEAAEHYTPIEATGPIPRIAV